MKRKLSLLVAACWISAVALGQLPSLLPTAKPDKIDWIFQDKGGDYWVASNGAGLFRYGRRGVVRYAMKEGLTSEAVWKVEADVSGTIWCTTRDGFFRFNGTRFVDYTDSIRKAPFRPLRYKAGGLFFNHLDGICFYDGRSFTNFAIHPANYTAAKNSFYRPYSVYTSVADRKGKIWFGTQEKGVGVYDGKGLAFITGNNLDGPAVRVVLEDRNGMFWFGNNGGGLFRYDGKELRNITKESGLGNPEFLRGRLVDKPGSLARVFAIAEDRNGDLWIGTADAGVWRYDGRRLQNFTMAAGLTSNSVTTIAKERNGNLLFVSGGTDILRFNGRSFVPAEFAKVQ